MWVKRSGVWVPVTKPPSTKDAGTWKAHKAMWAKVSGAWRRLVPPNAVVLYMTAAPSGTKVCDGTLGTPDLRDLMPRNDLTKSVLQLDGSGAAHTAADHGASDNRMTGTGPKAGASATLSFTDGAMNGSPTTHYHWLPPHTHPAVGPSVVQTPNVDLIPTVGGDLLFPNAVVPRIGSAEALLYLLDLTTDPAFLGRYVRMAATYKASGGPFAHRHDGASQMTINLTDWSENTTQKQPSRYSWPYTHRHAANHQMGDVHGSIDGPSSAKVRALVVQSKIGLESLPAGAVMLLLSDEYPEGWAPMDYPGLDLLHLRFSDGASYVESNWHGHFVTFTSGGVVTVSTKAGTTGSKTDERVISSHYHSADDYHYGSVPTAPPSVILRFAVKQ